jgi:hypothetical protein
LSGEHFVLTKKGSGSMLKRRPVAKIGAASAALFLFAACATTEATPAAGPSAGKASLETPPYRGDAPSAAPPSTTAPTIAAPSERPTFETVAAQFDPGRQHFVWVLPPGIHGKPPWTLTAVVKLRGDPRFETTLPLKAELLAPGSRPEYPAGYEIVRLSDDGQWTERTAELDRVIQSLIAEHGRGHGALEMTNDLNVTIDPTHRHTYCGAGGKPDLRLYVEEDGKADLIRLEADAMAGIIQAAVRKACAG